jgi:hypothetical protein
MKVFDDSPAEKAYKVIVFTIITVLTFGLVLIFGTVRRALFPKDRNR